MLGAALAGLSLVSTDAGATVYIESTDFGDSSVAATDLSSTFGNFLNDHGILGSMDSGGGDNNDFIRLNVAPSTSAVINFSASGTFADLYFYLLAYNSAGGLLASNSFSMPVIGQTYQSSLSFITPSDGIILLGAGGSSEGGPGTFNYSIGAVPEPTSALLGAAGLAAAAMRRRRNGK